MRTESGLCIYHLSIGSNLNHLHNSQWITFPTQSYQVLYSFCASLLHSFNLWLTVSSLSPYNIHLQFSCVLSILLWHNYHLELLWNFGFYFFLIILFLGFPYSLSSFFLYLWIFHSFFPLIETFVYVSFWTHFTSCLFQDPPFLSLSSLYIFLKALHSRWFLRWYCSTHRTQIHSEHPNKLGFSLL